MQDLPVVLDDLHGDAKLARDTPGTPVIDMLRRRIIDRADQSHGGTPARPRLTFATARPVAVPHVLELMAERAARLHRRKPIVQDDPVAPPVIYAAYAARELLPSDVHAQTHGLRFERRELDRHRIGYRIRYDTH